MVLENLEVLLAKIKPAIEIIQELKESKNELNEKNQQLEQTIYNLTKENESLKKNINLLNEKIAFNEEVQENIEQKLLTLIETIPDVNDILKTEQVQIENTIETSLNEGEVPEEQETTHIEQTINPSFSIPLQEDESNLATNDISESTYESKKDDATEESFALHSDNATIEIQEKADFIEHEDFLPQESKEDIDNENFSAPESTQIEEHNFISPKNTQGPDFPFSGSENFFPEFEEANDVDEKFENLFAYDDMVDDREEDMQEQANLPAGVY